MSLEKQYLDQVPLDMEELLDRIFGAGAGATIAMTNAVAVSFFNLLKRERVRRRTYRTREEARQAVFGHIEISCNSKRIHVRNGMLSPVGIEPQQEM